MRFRWLASSLALVALPTPTLAEAAQLVSAPSPAPTIKHQVCALDVSAGSCFDPLTLTVYLDSNSDKITRWHEVGHYVDHTLLSDTDRVLVSKRLGRPNSPWFAKPGPKYHRRSVGESFADLYAHCRDDKLTWGTETGFDWRPKYRPLCEWIDTKIRLSAARQEALTSLLESVR